MEEEGEEGEVKEHGNFQSAGEGRRAEDVAVLRDVLAARSIIHGTLKAMSGISGVSTRRHVHGNVSFSF